MAKLSVINSANASDNTIDEKFNYSQNILKRDFGIGRMTDDEGNVIEEDSLVFGFNPNSGKGTGYQIIPVNEFEDVMKYLDNIAKIGLNPSKRMNTVDIIKSSIVECNEIYTFRLSSGRSAKPVSVRKSDLPEFISLVSKIFESSKSKLEKPQDS